MCSFGLASVTEPPKNSAKLRKSFHSAKFSGKFFLPRPGTFLPGSGRDATVCQCFSLARVPDGTPGRDLRPESECKGRHFLRINQTFEQKFYVQKHCFSKLATQNTIYQQLAQILKITVPDKAKKIAMTTVSVSQKLLHLQSRPPQQKPTVVGHAGGTVFLRKGVY